MTQTTPATCVLGPGKTGLTIGLRVLNLDGTTYAAFSTTGVAETATAGTYRKAGGVVAPLAGGYIVWGTALVDYAEATVESAAVNVTYWAGVAAGAAPATKAEMDAAAALIMQRVSGSGAITFTYTLTSSVGGAPIADADVWVTSDMGGSNVLASGRTDQNGVVTFYLDAGTVYVWRQKSSWNFDNPDTEVVS